MLPNHTDLIQLIDKYELHFPDEVDAAEEFRDFVKRNSEKSVYSRLNFDGHFTASAFLINEARTHLLFLNHKKLNRWLQPGGHIDNTDRSILQAAIREVVEETGLQRNDLEVVMNEIVDLDAHGIPENTKKNEAAHVHYDIRYLLKVKNEAQTKLNTEEANGLRWLTFNEVKLLDGFAKVVNKLEAVKE